MRATLYPAEYMYLIATTAGVVLALAGYIMPGNGISGTPGALLVTVGAAALLMSGALLCFADLPRWMRITLAVLTIIGLILTAFAAYLLMSWLLLAALAVAAVAFVSIILTVNKPEYSQ